MKWFCWVVLVLAYQIIPPHWRIDAQDDLVPTCYTQGAKNATLDFYWIAKEGTEDAQSYWAPRLHLGSGPKNNTLVADDGSLIAMVDTATEGRCLDLGTCLLDNGQLINLGFTSSTFRFLDKTNFPFGIGFWSNPLVPFVSVGNQLPFHTTLCIKELENWKLPNNKTHNGCVRVDDYSGNDMSEACHVTFFVLEFAFFDRMLAANLPTKVTASICRCKILDYTTQDMYAFVDVGPPSKGSSHVIVWVGVALGVVLLLAMVGLLGFCCLKTKCCHEQIEHLSLMSGRRDVEDSSPKYGYLAGPEDASVSSAHKDLGAGLQMFSLSSMQLATARFNVRNKLGEGGFGVVYKGVLPDGTEVAVKQMAKTGSSRQGTPEFMNEVALIGQSQHRNLVRLYGYCLEGEERLLVYEFMEKGNLHQALFEQERLPLSWKARFNIILGTAKGLAYLHQSQRRIVHRDIKASNVLLDKHLQPKISDFGLAKFFLEEKSHVSTRVAGTVGYLAPEYALTGQLTEKADIFSFGVLVLEVVSGRRNLDFRNTNAPVFLLEWAWDRYEEGEPQDTLDPRIKDDPEAAPEEVFKLVHIALLCAQGTPQRRPSIKEVISMLEGHTECTSEPSRPEFLKNTSSILQSSSFVEGWQFLQPRT